MRKILISSLLLALSACSIYKVDIQQGNVLDPKQIEQLKVGMTKRQVLFIMGEPLLRDPFHQDRWDYIHLLKAGGKQPTRQLLTLYFDGDKLKRIDDSALEKTTLQ